jgi:hypothetical protein
MRAIMTKKKTTKKQPKTKVVYRTKTVYVEKKDDNPFEGVNDMVKTGAGAVITLGIAGAVVKGLKSI